MLEEELGAADLEMQALAARSQALVGEQQRSIEQLEAARQGVLAHQAEAREKSQQAAQADQEQRKHNKAQLDSERQQAIETIISSIVSGKVTEYHTSDVRQALECCDERQVMSVAIFAISKNNMPLFSLVSNGIEVDFRNADNQSLLHLACRESQYEMARQLLERGANLSDGSILYAYIHENNERGCELLLQHGIETECYQQQTDKKGCSGLGIAVVHRSLGICRLLLEHTLPAKRAQLLEYYHNHPRCCDRHSYLYGTALYLAVTNGYLDISKLLLHYKANPECYESNQRYPALVSRWR